MAISLIKEEEEHIIRVLPILLRKDRQFRQEVSFILSDTLIRKDELTKILDEMRQGREETNTEMRQHREETNKRFENKQRTLQN